MADAFDVERETILLLHGITPALGARHYALRDALRRAVAHGAEKMRERAAIKLTDMEVATGTVDNPDGCAAFRHAARAVRALSIEPQEGGDG